MGQSGQDLVEYVGLLAIIAVIVAALFMLGIPSVVAHAVSHAVNGIVGGSGTSRGTSG
jgi:hypothetical protein